MLTIQFSDIENRWIAKEKFNWHIKEGCPTNIKNGLKKKLDILNEKTYKYDFLKRGEKSND